VGVLKKNLREVLRKKAKRRFRGYPAATLAFYGPTATLANKVVVGIAKNESREIDPLKKWFSQDMDIRADEEVGIQVIAFLKEQGVRSIIVADRIMGCPHEEGIDYPEGKSCPQCPFWAGRDRFTHERIQ
jgi:hypothetical protein